MAQDKQAGFSRRGFIKGAAAVAAGGSMLPSAAQAAKPSTVPPVERGAPFCEGARDVNLVNGKFLTMDAENRIVSEVAIRDGRFAEVGAAGPLGPCARTIDLQGRTVVPGIIDSHIHFTRAGTNVGYETRWIETTFSIAELQQVIAERARSVPQGGFITAMGGWTPLQFAEQRLPTKAELDAAAPNHGVLLMGRTNSAGAAFFGSRGIAVDADGNVSNALATSALRSIQTFEDKVRGTAELIAWAASVGMTSCHDTSNLTVQPDDYRVMNTLYHRSGRRLDIRMRHYRYFPTTNLPALIAYMDPIFKEIGDETYRINGVGEQIGSDNLADFETNLRAVAQAGWRVQQHHAGVSQSQRQVDAFRNVVSDFPEVRELRWLLGHADLTEAQIQTLISIDVGVTCSRGPARRFLDTTLEGRRIRAGIGTDGTNVSWINPWMQMYFLVTRRNQQGTLVQDGQQISRLEALRLYTMGSAWFSNEEHELGSIEEGKLADLVVLSDDYLSVPDARIPKIRSVLTLQGGRVVHSQAQ